MNPKAFAPWQPHLALAITGHRPDNASLEANEAEVRAVLSDLFDRFDRLRRADADLVRPVRLHCLLAGGVDQVAAHLALERDWSLIAPLPFGAELNLAINAGASSASDVRALARGERPGDPEVERRAAAIRGLMDRAHVFQIADRDEEIRAVFEQTLDEPANKSAAHRFAALASDNVALAGRVMIERCDLLIAVWDGKMTDLPGGTGHTVLHALEQGTPVLVIDPAMPQGWSILVRPEELGHRKQGDGNPDGDRLDTLVRTSLGLDGDSMDPLDREKWRPKAGFFFGFYRRIEAFFGGRSVKSGTTKAAYESPEDIANGSAASVVDAAQELLGADKHLHSRIRDSLLPMFAWADAVSSRLSDAYRSGMSLNFILSALAIIAGIAYLPFDLAKYKWIFASIELALLVLILSITYAGARRAWHRRWFETRRVAEYLRFAPGILMMGVSRPIARWPRAETAQWPERYVRDALRDAGLPEARVDRAYLRRVLSNVVLPHVRGQRQYHAAKAEQLHRVHHRIDKTAEWGFLAAVVSVSIYLLIELGALAGVLPAGWPYATAKLFTFLGVAFPTIGANLAGIRYFGDFERFSSISRVTVAKLADVEERIVLLLSGDEQRLTYHVASDLVRAIDDIVVEEIESWQAVYGAKHLALPA
ncbi:hypothetical protein CD351_14315 [Erythrobacter sp. KY5]|uniref:hypothetical protein n=1 Tax=Erythrobacter sp. KY5 TaxID=2011159 RepID=UPI000DBF1716|nr:hypothetical protein [Erythrobacter sp. KY5]AWW75608.1 hypothetical protein CD351_14315 [Erythrobacter sp. KY5]